MINKDKLIKKYENKINELNENIIILKRQHELTQNYNCQIQLIDELDKIAPENISNSLTFGRDCRILKIIRKQIERQLESKKHSLRFYIFKLNRLKEKE